MPAPFNNLRSKNDRAIVAFLIDQDCGSVDDILPAKSSKDKKYPNTVVHSTLSKTEVMGTGLRRVSVQIHLRGSAAIDPEHPDVDKRVQFDERVATTMDAMMGGEAGDLDAVAQAITEAGRSLSVVQDPNDPDSVALAAENADMVDYTCQAVFDQGEGDGEDTDSEGCAWHEVLLFEVLCSASNVD